MIETANLLLRPYSPEDAEELFQILSDPVTMSFWPTPYTMEETRSWIIRSIESYKTYGFGRYPILLKRDRKLVGDCGIVRAEKAGETLNDLGYIIHHPYWRRGYATEAATAVLNHAFDELGLDVVHANMPHHHDASRIVAERIGMTQIGEFINERNQNIRTLLYAIDRSKRQLAPLV